MCDYNTPAISPDVEILYRMLMSLENPKFDWEKIGASMGLSASAASTQFDRLRDKITKTSLVVQASTTPSDKLSPKDSDASPTKRKANLRRADKKETVVVYEDNNTAVEYEDTAGFFVGDGGKWDGEFFDVRDDGSN